MRDQILMVPFIKGAIEPAVREYVLAALRGKMILCPALTSKNY